ncbi:RimJ/RimL family protein N-acetyltransferase [Roseibium hamelinense]|uniref:RimJ/RimL family protein N-acetyltransferase n=1 Tax=Roseibium hamelinense TaxID=150831 RepID=A0A562T313_9HYPH|nr:GNAT family N-acetyltransferase [Roseibium hamelinense]MTI43780.1 N-acetyltransferase [Roseibium hamelinense]TWI87140.1 RimJ/RimL family protein N-acetyltransferase [Roseibium hamelinense]
MNATKIITDRLTLRPARLKDLESCAEMLGDYEVAKMLTRVSHPYDMQVGRDFLGAAERAWRDWHVSDELLFHIDLDDRMIGGVSLRKLRETPRIGYWLGQRFWGRGYMSEAVHAVIAWLFENTSHNAIKSEAMDENPASLRVMQKMGFRVVGHVECHSLARGCTMPATHTHLHRTEFTGALLN